MIIYDKKKGLSLVDLFCLLFAIIRRAVKISHLDWSKKVCGDSISARLTSSPVITHSMSFLRELGTSECLVGASCACACGASENQASKREDKRMVRMKSQRLDC